MPITVQVALATAPLAFYLYALGVFQSDRRPRVLSGPVDQLLLIFGLSGLILFGPIGGDPFGLKVDPTRPGSWLLAIGALALAGSGIAAWSANRLVIYNATSSTVAEALAMVLEARDRAYRPTLDGFELLDSRCAIRLEGSTRLRVVTVEFRGADAPKWIKPISGEVERFLTQGPEARTGGVAWLMYGLSSLTMLGPLAVLMATRPETLAALRAWFHP